MKYQRSISVYLYRYDYIYIKCTIYSVLVSLPSIINKHLIRFRQPVAFSVDQHIFVDTAEIIAFSFHKIIFFKQAAGCRRPT